ncbi:hypothetical protein IWQ61_005441 [Dispira simplex]|nr:hypothetical protein IWQ61_005441 [Dispira simplex]
MAASLYSRLLTFTFGSRWWWFGQPWLELSTSSVRSTIMSTLDNTVSHVLVYVTIVVFLAIGLYAGRHTGNSKELFLASRRSQKALPLGLNFLATSVGTWILFSLPEVAAIAGLLGIFAYSIACVLPLMVFAWLGPIIRQKNPDGFSLVSYILKRFGYPLHILYCIVIIVYLGLFLTSEFAGIKSILNLLASIDGPVPVVVIAIVTTIYTTYGGLRASIFTDSIQAALSAIMIIIAVIAIATSVRFDHDKAVDSGLLGPTKLGWQLLYIMPVAVTFSGMYHQGFWQRTFAASDDRTLWQSSIIGSVTTFPVLVLIGVTGLIAVWAGTLTEEQEPFEAFFSLYKVTPPWVLGFTLVLSVSLVCCSVDTLQCALVSSVSELFGNRLSIWWCRAITVIINVPTLWLSLKDVDIMQLFLVADLLASATILPVVLGLIKGSERYYNGWEAFLGCIGGLVSVIIFGWIYYGDFIEGINVFILSKGLFVEDESILGAFIVAPLSSVFTTALVSGLRIVFVKYILKRDPFISEAALTTRNNENDRTYDPPGVDKKNRWSESLNVYNPTAMSMPGDGPSTDWNSPRT